ncbi:MAG: hypothetical protein LBT03_03255 [Holosporales bacterium]|jgi:hypothetical protein|nr:hypothetical protein [Holosporales bacterium]
MDMYRAILIGTYLFSLSAVGSSQTDAVSNYVLWLAKVRQAERQEKKQKSYDKLKECAELLLGFVKNVQFKSYPTIEPFCDALAQEAKKIASSAKLDDLRAKRDSENCIEIAKFLIVLSKLLDSIYGNPLIIDLILSKAPEDVPSIAVEITQMLKILRVVIANLGNTGKSIEMMRAFAKDGEDGTHLLSIFTSVALQAEDIKKLNVREILEKTDFTNRELHKYFKVR